MERVLTCIECPMGCQLKVEYDGSQVLNVIGNTCARGKLYAENEVICPKRVVTSTVKTCDGKMVSVKTKEPIRKSEMFAVMQKINSVVAKMPIKIGDVVCEDICDGVSLIATMELD